MMNYKLMSKKPAKFADLINCLFECYVITQREHWKVKGPGSYASHMALGAFYDFIPDFMDGLVEAYQSKYGIIPDSDFSDICCKTGNYLSYIKEKRAMIQSKRYDYIPEIDTELHNELDNFIMQMNSLIYKLTNLQ